MSTGLSTAEILRQYGPDDEGPIEIRFPLEVGALVAGLFADAIAYGRSIGCTIEAHRGGGLLVRRYQVVVSGPWPKSRQFLKLLVDMEESAT